MRRTLKTLAAAVGAAALAATYATSSAYAADDNLKTELVGTSATTFAAGGSSSLNYYLQQNSSTCDAAVSPVVVTINAPAGLSASPSSLTFTACKSGPNNNAQTVTFSSSVPGTYAVTPSLSGGTPGGPGFASVTTTFTVTGTPDTSAPVVVPTITGTQGANGWYTSDVNVVWSVTDAESAISSTTGCESQDLTLETVGTTVTCSATSAGGTTTVSRTIKLDKTGPSANLSPSGTSGDGGWFISDVDVTTSGSDTVSGPVTCTALQSLTSETAGQTVNGTCTNAAGLATSATPLTVKIDKTAPVDVSSSVTSGTAGTGGWYTSDVTVTTTGTDTVSGVSCSTTTLTTNTTGTSVPGSCTNGAGLSADADPLTVKIDKTGPTAALSIAAGTLGLNGWYTDDVTVRTSGADGESDVSSCTEDQILSTDTTADGLDVNGACTNGAGTTTNASPINVKRDASPPTAELVVTAGTPGDNGWYTSAVTVTVQGADPQSGVSCFGGGTASGDTEGITFVGHCVNGAGVRTDATSLLVKVDTTAPSAALAVTAGTLGAGGWYTSDVTVSATGSDAVSGPVSCTPATQVLSTESATNTADAVCTNGAGLSTNATQLVVKIDKSAPTDVNSVISTGTAGTNGWYTSDVTVSTTGTDALSGVTCSPLNTLQEETSGTEAAGSCTNGAGLVAVAPSLIVKIDKTGPTGVAIAVTSGTLGSNDWYTSDVTLATTGTELLSGPVTCTPDQVISTDGGPATYSGNCTNAAGLAGTPDSISIKRDATPPTALTFGGPADGA